MGKDYPEELSAGAPGALERGSVAQAREADDARWELAFTAHEDRAKACAEALAALGPFLDALMATLLALEAGESVPLQALGRLSVHADLLREKLRAFE